MSARNYWETCSEHKTPEGTVLIDPWGNTWKVVPPDRTSASDDILDALGTITFVQCSEVRK
jgi:hypothetical protein